MEPERTPVGTVATFLVEGLTPEASVAFFADADRRLAASLADLRRAGIPIRAIAGTLVPRDEAAYWIVDGPSMQMVALAYERAGIRVERIVDALELRRSPARRAFGRGNTDMARVGDQDSPDDAGKDVMGGQRGDNPGT